MDGLDTMTGTAAEVFAISVIVVPATLVDTVVIVTSKKSINYTMYSFVVNAYTCTCTCKC